MRVAVPLPKCYRLINHGPTTLITSAHAGRRNVMAAAWVMGIDFDPPRVAAVIAEGTYTRSLVEASGEFVIAVPTAAQTALTRALGSESGSGVDKFAKHALAVEPASKVAPPLIAGCAAWLECRVIPEPAIAQRYDLFVAEVVAAWADDASFRDGRWAFPDDAHRTIHHVAGGHFLRTGDPVGP
ncbi:MAG TPA: flavin reductase family protein [Candidatus Polarisedimenticolaceae bacterium]